MVCSMPGPAWRSFLWQAALQSYLPTSHVQLLICKVYSLYGQFERHYLTGAGTVL